ncbi:MAG: hypothetical protein ACRDAM_03565, partial [Casimicrobium sp.]
LAVRAAEFEALREGVAEPTMPPNLDETKIKWWMWATPLAVVFALLGLLASPWAKGLRDRLRKLVVRNKSAAA